MDGRQTAAIAVNVPISVASFAASGMGRWVDFMTREQECIVELYTLLERIEDGARHHDLSLLRGLAAQPVVICIKDCLQFVELKTIS